MARSLPGSYLLRPNFRDLENRMPPFLYRSQAILLTEEGRRQPCSFLANISHKVWQRPYCFSWYEACGYRAHNLPCAALLSLDWALEWPSNHQAAGADAVCQSGVPLRFQRVEVAEADVQALCMQRATAAEDAAPAVLAVVWAKLGLSYSVIFVDVMDDLSQPQTETAVTFAARITA